MASYATVADLQDYFDWREIGDLISDSNEKISALDQVTTGNVYNTRLLRFLQRASAELESVVLKGGRYSVTDLTGLTGNSLELLKAITCEFVMVYLYERKPFWNPERMESYRKVKTERLEKFAKGANIFNLPLVIEAGQASVTGPSTIDYSTNYNLVTDRVKGYPRRALPYNR